MEAMFEVMSAQEFSVEDGTDAVTEGHRVNSRAGAAIELKNVRFGYDALTRGRHRG